MRLLRLLKIVRLLRLLRVLKLLRLLGKYATRFRITYRMRAILKFICYIMVTSHWAACLFRVVSNRAYERDPPFDDDDGATDGAAAATRKRRVLAEDAKADGNPTWLREEGMHAEGLWAQYAAAMAWAVQALNGSANAYTGAEYCVSVVVMIVGCIVLTLMIGEIANVSTSLDPAGNDYKRTMDMFNSYMDERGFHRRLKAELRTYFMQSEGLFREQHYKHSILGNLSPQLREKLAMANVGPWIKSVPVCQYAMVKASGLFRGAKVAVAQPPKDSGKGGDENDDDDPSYSLRAAVVSTLSDVGGVEVTYRDGAVEFRVDASRLHVPRYLPLGRTFFAAKRANELLITDLAGRMTATLYLRHDAIVATGSPVDNMYLLVDGQALKRDKARVMHKPRERRLYGDHHDVIGEDITMKLTTAKELTRNHEVTARTTSHCLCLSSLAFLESLKKPAFATLVSPMKRYAGWLMLREHCVFHPRVVHEHMDVFSAAQAKLFALRLQGKVQEQVGDDGGGQLKPTLRGKLFKLLHRTRANGSPREGGGARASAADVADAGAEGTRARDKIAGAIVASRLANQYVDKLKHRNVHYSPRSEPCERAANEVLQGEGLHELAPEVASPRLPRGPAAAEAYVEPESENSDTDGDGANAPRDSAAAAVAALSRGVAKTSAAAKRVSVDPAAEAPRAVDELKYELRQSINALISVYRELDPDAPIMSPGKRRRKAASLGKHVPPIPADWDKLFPPHSPLRPRPFDTPDPRPSDRR